MKISGSHNSLQRIKLHCCESQWPNGYTTQVFREGLSDMVTLGLRSELTEGACHVNTRGIASLDEGNN